MSASKKTSAKQSSFIYCGPNLPNGLLTQHTVFRGSLPSHLDSHFESCPALRRMIVPVEQFSSASKALAQEGTPENVWLKEVTAHFTGGNKR